MEHGYIRRFRMQRIAYLTTTMCSRSKPTCFSLSPVTNKPPESDLRFPYNQRWLMVFWSGLFKPKRSFQPVSGRSAEWNRGAYLSEALAHCGDCHTPRNLLQALDNNNKYTGAVVDGWRAYNITADPASGVGNWSEAELAQYLSTGHAKGRGTASGPMAQAVTFSLEKLTASDIHAIVTYLRSVPAVVTSDLPAPKADSATVNPKQGVAAEIDPRGKQIFEGACASCHDWTGVSPLDSRATLTGGRAVNDPTAINVAQIVLSGSKWQPSGATLAMPAFGAAYSDQEIAAVSNYVTARFGMKGSSIRAEDVQRLR
jgi:mono/diheme cytochrome c family protein